MIIKIEIPEECVNEIFNFFVASTNINLCNYSLNSSRVYYNLRKSDTNEIVNIYTNPELFHDDFPFVHTDTFSTTLVDYTEPFITVDWGDGSSSEIKSTVYTLKINDIEYNYNAILNHYVSHKYSDSGEYTVKIRANIAQFYFLTKNRYDDYCWRLKEIVNWGEFRLRSAYQLLNRAYNDNAVWSIKFPDFSQVVSADSFFGESRIYIDKNGNKYSNLFECRDLNSFEELPIKVLEWDKDFGGENFMSRFPKLMSAYRMFNKIITTHIPESFFSVCQYLQNLDYAFGNSIFEYIGDGACANLSYLQSAQNCFDFYNSIYINDYNSFDGILKNWIPFRPFKYIGNSIFENDINLQNVDAVLRVSGFISYVNIGDSIFKNCTSLTKIEQSVFPAFSICLQTVGNSIFEGCSSLRQVNNVLRDNYNLRSIGENIFKGCTNLVGTEYFCQWALRLKNIPDNFYTDVKYNEDIDYTDYNLWIPAIQYGLDWYLKEGDNREYCSLNKELIQKRADEDGLAFDDEYFNIVWNNLLDSTPNIEFKRYEIWDSEDASEFKRFLINSQSNDFCLTLGKNIYSEEFLTGCNDGSKKLNITIDGFSPYQHTWVYPTADEYGNIYGNEIAYVSKMLVQGEAPPFWNYSNSLGQNGTVITPTLENPYNVFGIPNKTSVIDDLIYEYKNYYDNYLNVPLWYFASVN